VTERFGGEQRATLGPRSHSFWFLDLSGFPGDSPSSAAGTANDRSTLTVWREADAGGFPRAVLLYLDGAGLRASRNGADEGRVSQSVLMRREARPNALATGRATPTNQRAPGSRKRSGSASGRRGSRRPGGRSHQEADGVGHLLLAAVHVMRVLEERDAPGVGDRDHAGVGVVGIPGDAARGVRHRDQAVALSYPTVGTLSPGVGGTSTV